MNRSILSLCLALLLPGMITAAPRSGITKTTSGSQHVYQEANSTIVIAPQFQRPVVASLKVRSAVSPSPGTAVFTLDGSSPVDSYGAPLIEDRYTYDPSSQPNTYYALVTAGNRRGEIFTVESNTGTTITVSLDGLTLQSRDVKAIDIRPYWTLATLFPADRAYVSFIPTTPTSGPMTHVIISPFTTNGPTQPINAGTKYFFNSTLDSWVEQGAPGVPAGDAIIPPGRYVYVQNTGTNNYPLHTYIAGTVLSTQFIVHLASSNTPMTNYFALPRASDYRLTQIGFNDSNFNQSTDKSLSGLNDLLIVDDGAGGVAASYYRFKNRWYELNNDSAPTDPVFPAGTVFGLRKTGAAIGTPLLINQPNVK